ncbi:MAG: T9SS type B sorting domain-containing protein [Flavobacterium sp.]|nr:T9SS type B sorting domain-containing protein [Flavobacterium sp.]
MKKIFILFFTFLVLNIFSQNQVTTANSTIQSVYINKKIEDANGNLITSINEKIKYFENKQKQLFRLSQKNKFLKTTTALTPVYLCSNGAFEEFSTVGTNNFLNDFLYTEGEVLNPIQCKNLNQVATIEIPQYDPTNLSIMSTTVPSNYIDDYIGNIDAFDQFALKINYKNSYTTVASVQAKRFKTNNENTLKFNYKAVLQSINTDNHVDEQPYFKARVINNNGVVVSEFCLIANTDNCIFTQAPNLESDAIIMYTPNWQSGILDISSIPNNENFTVEFTATRCGLGAHFGYAYVDDLCFLHSNESLQGSIELDPLYKICPTLPISVCGSFTVPSSGGISATVTSIVLKVRDTSNNVVYTSQTPVTLNLTTNRFCFDLVATNLPNIIDGSYNVSVTINYGIIQTSCIGTNFASATDDDANPGWDIWFLNCTNCPVSVQTASLSLCDTNKDGKEFFNLTNANDLIINPSTGLTFSYFTNLIDATTNSNPITAFTNYESYSTTVFVRITLNATCYKIIPIQLIVKNPHATISGILNVCYGSTVLTASAGTSYLWNYGNTTPSITVSLPGVYSVNVIDSFGCSSTTSVTILANQAAPQPTILVTQPSCTLATGSITITSPATLYSYDGGLTWVTNSTISNLGIGNYNIKITTSTGCISYPVTIAIVPYKSSYPNFVKVDPAFCGDKGTITITTVADFYSFDDGVTWSTNNVASNLSPGTYKIRTKNNAGCVSNYNSVYLFDEFLSPPSYTINNPYCGNLGSITIVTPATQFSFDGGITWQTSNTLSGLTSGSYIIKIKNADGCTSQTVYVYLNNLENTYPEFTIDPAGCGKYNTITITTLGDLYSFDGGLTWSTSNILSNLDGGITYTIQVQKNPNCKTFTQQVNLNNMYGIIPNATDYSTIECDNLNDGSEFIDLANYNTNLISNSNNYTFSYFTSLAGAENQLPTNQITNFTSYLMSNINDIVYVRVMNNTCYKVVQLKIDFINSPVIYMNNIFPLCVDKSVVIEAGLGYSSYLWSTGETTDHITITQPGNYWVTVYENHNNGLICSTIKNFKIFLSNFATITNVDIIDWTDIENVITVIVTGTENVTGDYEYSLDDIHYQDSNTFSNLTTGVYTVFVRDKNGCGVVNQEVFILNYPRFFTPNDDLINDTWNVKFSKYEPEMKVEIYDRHGKLLKILDGTNSWDGIYNGNKVISDDYWFVVHRVNGLTHKGHFTLKR